MEEVIISCSNCNKNLAIIPITDKHSPFEWNIQVECCFCGDKSFIHNVKGTIGYSGYHYAPDMLKPDNVVALTNVTTTEIINIDGLDILYMETEQC